MSSQAEVISHTSLGRDAALLRLRAPDLAGPARPGQFLMLRVAPGDDPLLARPFSYFLASGDEVWIMYQVVGRGTRLLRQARPGDRLAAWGPLGRGFDLSARRPLLVGGGMGLAPLAFALRDLIAAGAEPMLCWGLATAGPVVEVLRPGGLEGGPDLSHALLATEDGSQGHKGLVTDLLAGRLDQCDAVLACGPLPMLRAVAGLCAESDAACQVSLEAPMACGVGACLGCVLPRSQGGYLRVCQEGPVVPAAEVGWEAL